LVQARLGADAHLVTAEIELCSPARLNPAPLISRIDHSKLFSSYRCIDGWQGDEKSHASTANRTQREPKDLNSLFFASVRVLSSGNDISPRVINFDSHRTYDPAECAGASESSDQVISVLDCRFWIDDQIDNNRVKSMEEVFRIRLQTSSSDNRKSKT